MVWRLIAVPRGVMRDWGNDEGRSGERDVVDLHHRPVDLWNDHGNDTTEGWKTEVLVWVKYSLSASRNFGGRYSRRVQVSNGG
jgi:hypothetical protein